MRRFLTLLLATLPGSVAILRGRTAFGIALMAIGIIGADAAYLFYAGDWTGPTAAVVGRVGAIASLLALLTSWIWTTFETSERRREARRRTCEEALRAAYHSYLRGKPIEAMDALDGGLRRQKDDPDLLFVRWRLAVENESRGTARRWLKRLFAADEEAKWESMVERERARDAQA